MAKSVVRFPAYRQFSDARVEINDAMMALMIGARLGEHTLSNSPAAPEALLPTLFGRIRSIKRLNRSVADAAILLEAAEGHLVYMAIPYALALHGVYVVAGAGMVRADGHDEVDRQTTHPYQNDLFKLPLDIAHEYVEDRCEGHLSPELLALFHLSRRIRNRIVHAGGAVGSRLLGEYLNLPKHVRETWEDWAGRPLTEATSNGRLELGEGELIAVLAISRHLAQDLNAILVKTLSRTYWADEVIRDYRSTQPQRFGEQAQLARRLRGLATKYYSPLRLEQHELDAALARSREAGSSY